MKTRLPAVNICIMPRLTVTLDEDLIELIEEKSGDGGEYESKSEAVRSLIRDGERAEELKRKAERLEREKRQILEQREENKELAKFAEQERTLQEERLRASALTRAKWWLFGRQGE